jgi:hypothetical protein
MPRTRSVTPALPSAPSQVAKRPARLIPAVLAAAFACAGAAAQPIVCPDDPRCPGGGGRAEGRAATDTDPGSRPGPASRATIEPRPAAPAPRDPGATFDRDGRFQGSLGGRHPFDAGYDAGRGGASRR